jgi:hypothetical protein
VSDSEGCTDGFCGVVGLFFVEGIGDGGVVCCAVAGGGGGLSSLDVGG